MNPETPTLPSTKEHRYHLRLFWLLVQPSWLSLLASTTLSIAGTVFLLARDRYEGSGLQQQFTAWQQTPEVAARIEHHTLSAIINSLQLFAIWYAIGLVAYIIGNALYTVFRSARETNQDLHAVHADPTHIWMQTSVQIIRQTVAAIVWFALAVWTLKVLLPYCVGIMQIANAYLPDPLAVGSLCLTTLGAILWAHIQVVLIRLFLGKPRIWHAEDYTAGL